MIFIIGIFSWLIIFCILWKLHGHFIFWNEKRKLKKTMDKFNNWAERYLVERGEIFVERKDK